MSADIGTVEASEEHKLEALEGLAIALSSLIWSVAYTTFLATTSYHATVHESCEWLME
jgi:hypothetical protein